MSRKKSIKDERRQFTRLRIDRSVQIPIHIYPEMPFIGNGARGVLSNISPGGMALIIDSAEEGQELARGAEFRVHFRLPGRPPQECRGVLNHLLDAKDGSRIIGIAFTQLSDALLKDLEAMSSDNDACDTRVASGANAWCLPTCSFHSLCRKPIRPPDNHSDTLEIVLQER